MKQILLYLIIILLAIDSLLLGAETDDKEDEDKWGIGFYPIIGYSDDTNLVLGGGSVFYFNPDPKNKNQQLDELELNANYSLNNQLNVRMIVEKYFFKNDHNLQSKMGYSKYPDSFYGIGGNTLSNNKEVYTPIYFTAEISYSVNVWKNLYIGGIYSYKYFRIISLENDGILSRGEITGSKAMHSSGIGIKISYKTTNPGIYKRNGFKISFSYKHFSSIIFSNSAFDYFKIDYRHYFSILEKCVLALHIRGESVSGDVPFYYLPSLGGSRILRGYGSSRYIANNYIGVQTEFRFPVFWRIGGVVFFGAGEVADQPEQFGSNIRVAGGLGLRFMIQKRQHINLRFDLTYNSDGEIRKYIKIKEAF